MVDIVTEKVDAVDGPGSGHEPRVCLLLEINADETVGVITGIDATDYPAALPSNQHWSDVAWDGSVYCAVINNGTAAATSTTAGDIGAVSSILGSVGSVSSKWLQAGQSFGNTSLPGGGGYSGMGGWNSLSLGG